MKNIDNRRGNTFQMMMMMMMMMMKIRIKIDEAYVNSNNQA